MQNQSALSVFLIVFAVFKSDILSPYLWLGLLNLETSTQPLCQPLRHLTVENRTECFSKYSCPLSLIRLDTVDKLISSIGAMLTREDFPQVSNLYTCTQTQEPYSYYLCGIWCPLCTFQMLWRWKHLWVIHKIPFHTVNKETLQTPNHVRFQPLVYHFHPEPFIQKHEHCHLSSLQYRLWTFKKKNAYQELCWLFLQDQHQSRTALRTTLQYRNFATSWWDVPPSLFSADSQPWICQNP